GGYGRVATGTINASKSSLNVTCTTSDNYQSTATLAMTGTNVAVTSASGCVLPVLNVNIGGTLSLSGTLVTLSGWVWTGGSFSQGSSNMQFMGTITPSNLSYANTISLGYGSFTTTQSGTMTIAGDLVIAGVVTVATINLAGDFTMN